MKKYLVLTLVVMLVACASRPPEITPEQEAAQHAAMMRLIAERDAALKPISCANREQCDRYWTQVRSWIASNSSWRIRTATGVLIQTDGPGAGESSLAYTARRDDQADGAATIAITAECDPAYGCELEPWQAIEKLKAYATR